MPRARTTTVAGTPHPQGPPRYEGWGIRVFIDRRRRMPKQPLDVGYADLFAEPSEAFDAPGPATTSPAIADTDHQVDGDGHATAVAVTPPGVGAI